ncbi:MAG: histidine kinase [Anaerolineae bacterium]|jgi:signal transduction histidine kinase
MPRWLRSLRAQLFLWAVLPVTFVIIALAFTGVYAHQRVMRDFVAQRDMAMAGVTARTVEDALAHGTIGADGQGLSAWMAPLLGRQPGTVMVVDGEGQVLAHPDPDQVGTDLRNTKVGAAALGRRSPSGSGGSLIISSDTKGRVLIAFATVGGTDWTVLIQEPVEELIGPVLRLSNLAPAVAVGAAALSVLILTFGWRTIVTPLQELVQAAEQVSWGDFSAISEPVGGVQEIRDLQQALADMAKRIRGYQAGMRDYLRAMTEGQEAERARLAREIHDGPVQDLITLGQRAEMAQRLMGRGEAEQAQRMLGELREAELETVRELRRLIGALRPAYLEDLGFIPALEMLVQQAGAQTSADVHLEEMCNTHRLPPEAELVAYRIAQEALNNAVQHAQAQNITVRVRCSPQGLKLSVIDDGAGFDLPRRPDLLTRAGHFGLLGMRERATLLGGTLQIHATPGVGTEVTVRLPGRPAPA